MTETKRCLCGCGETPMGGRFLPGHDARMEPLYRRWRDGDEGARVYRAQMDYFRERGWVTYDVRG
jgi:hypothetical protein